SIVDSDVFVKSNIDGVHNLLELIRKRQKYKMPTLLHFSTDEVYGDILSGSHNESSMLKPSNPYSATKASADMLVTAWGRTFNIPYIIARPTNNYGIGQYTEKLIPKAIKYLQLGRKIPVHENGMPKRTWLHVTDTAKAIMRIIEHGKLGEIYNISGNYENKNIIVLDKIISQFFGHDDFEMSDHVDFSYSRPGQDVRYSIWDSKLRELGWKPTADFDDKIKQIVEYHKNNFKW
ncbi:MAG: GDP-mannose 4,6-dehydratase, partial [Nitrososphaerota archaeon]